MMRAQRQAADLVEHGSRSLVHREPDQAAAVVSRILIALRAQPARIERSRGTVLPFGWRVAAHTSRLAKILAARETRRGYAPKHTRVNACSFQPTAETHRECLPSVSVSDVRDRDTGRASLCKNSVPMSRK